MSINDGVVHCPACGETTHNFVEACNEYKIMACHHCNLSFSDPMIGGNSAFYKEHLVYKAVDQTTILQHCTSARKPSNSRLLRMAPKMDRILDVGCGYGAFVKFAVQEGYDAFGIDFNDEHIQAGKAFLSLEGRLFLGDVANVNDILGKESQFGLVTLFEVIEHVVDPLKLIQSVRNVLTKGGLLAISCPNEARWSPTGRVFVDYPPHHLTRWRPDTLRSFLEQQGFEHVRTEIESSFSDLLWVAYVNRSAKRKIGSKSPEAVTKKVSPHVRSCKMLLYKGLKAISRPFDLFLSSAGIGTMGMRMIVRKI